MKIFRYIYKTTNKVNGKIYVGCHKTTNLEDGYIGSGKVLKRALKKYGPDNFQKDILQFFESDEEMYGMESVLVNEEFVGRQDTYNVKLGGQGGWDFVNKEGLNNYPGKNISCSESMQKALLIFLEKMKDPFYKMEHNKKVSRGLKKYFEDGGFKAFEGKHHTDETKQRISEKNKISQGGENNSQYGKKWIHNRELRESKSIPGQDLEKWLNDGWKIGRVLDFDKPIKKTKLPIPYEDRQYHYKEPKDIKASYDAWISTGSYRKAAKILNVSHVTVYHDVQKFLMWSCSPTAEALALGARQ